MKQVIVAGGGISGLITAALLAKAGFRPLVIEKKIYPFHRVCGEYISNETVSFLKRAGLYPEKFDPPQLSRFQLTSVNGQTVTLKLDLGGFGISRYSFDNFLYENAGAAGALFRLNTQIDGINWVDDHFTVHAGSETFHADVVVGSFGKRSVIDAQMNRSFMGKRSPYLGVKYHIRTDHPGDLIALHNFKDGYCGISNIEGNRSNLCYLTHRNNLKAHGQIKAMEEKVLFRNPFLKRIFTQSEFLFDRPETINEISFETKAPVEDHVIMVGDAAGMITPLCGNGMAMAIHSASVASEVIIRFCNNHISRDAMESEYSRQWNKLFSARLTVGRRIQAMFGREWTSDMLVNLARYARPVAQWLVSKTHGASF